MKVLLTVSQQLQLRIGPDRCHPQLKERHRPGLKHKYPHFAFSWQKSMICLDGRFLLEGPNVIFTDLTSPCTFLDHRETRSVSCEKANGIKIVRVTIPGRTAAKEGWDEGDLKEVVKWSSWSIADPVGWGWCGRPVVATVAMALPALIVACLWFSHSVHTWKAKTPNEMSNPEHQTVSEPLQVTRNLVLTQIHNQRWS